MTGSNVTLPRYVEQFRNLYSPTHFEERAAGQLGAQMIYTHQEPGDWSDPPTSDLSVSIALDAVPFELAIAGEKVRERYTPARTFIVASPGADVRYIQKAPMRALMLAVPSTVLTRYQLEEDVRGVTDFAPLHPSPSQDPEVMRLMEGFWSAARDGFLGGHLQSDGYVLQLIAALLRLRDGRVRPVKGGLSTWQMRLSAGLLDDPEAGSLSLNDLASAVGLSPFHFARAFKQSFGMPPHRYQMLRRLEHARTLLRDTPRSVTEIALAVGYESSQALAKVFRREVGTTPSLYRADWS